MTSRPATPPKAPPPPPERASRSVVLEQRIDLDQLRRIAPQDGDVLVLPSDFPPDLVRDFTEALLVAKPGLKCLVVHGDLRRLSVSEMNAAGWYRA